MRLGFALVLTAAASTGCLSKLTEKTAFKSTSGIMLRASAALQMESDYELARVAIPASLKTIEGFYVAGPPDGNLYLWAARFYAWMAHKPAGAKGDWYPDLAGAKERCRTLLRQAAEAGVPEDSWKKDSTFGFLFGDPAVYARDWVRPAKEADPWNNFRTGDPLAEFPG